MADTYQAGVIISENKQYAITATARDSIAVYQKQTDGKFYMVNELPSNNPLALVLRTTLLESKADAERLDTNAEQADKALAAISNFNALAADIKETMNKQHILVEEVARVKEESCKFAPQPVKDDFLSCIRTSDGQQRIAGMNVGITYQAGPKVSLQTDLPFARLASPQHSKK